jgi:predicted kinase
MKVVIMRGVSGSGKSTKAKELSSGTNSSIICSADDFFMRDGKYNFDPKMIGQAHAYCRGKFYGALELGVELVIIDNTNTGGWEYAEYVESAKEAGYEVEIVKVGNTDTESLQKYHERNRHSVPFNVIQKQAERLDMNP